MNQGKRPFLTSLKKTTDEEDEYGTLQSLLEVLNERRKKAKIKEWRTKHLHSKSVAETKS